MITAGRPAAARRPNTARGSISRLNKAGFRVAKFTQASAELFRLTKCARAMTRAGYAKTVPTTVRLEGFNQWKEDIADASLGPDEVWRTRIDLQFTPQS